MKMKASIPALKGRHIITQGFIPVPLHPCAQPRVRRGAASLCTAPRPSGQHICKSALIPQICVVCVPNLKS